MQRCARHNQDAAANSSQGIFFTRALFPIAAIVVRKRLFENHGDQIDRAARHADPEPLGRRAEGVSALGACRFQLAVFLSFRLICDGLFLAVRAGRLEIQPGGGKGTKIGRPGRVNAR